ncbi:MULTISPECIES: glycosyl hydrolase family 28-related protein [Paenibacillus]|uniref:glycosyl hydrolase family 28-related protein n=1 Tax=Paenibacillus TaxID=44249 RepID=UPI0022B8F9CA|nr:glycosyl hydrolase family 28-related protein [Paenibacillus caseinilyticus]MCZ8520111.1 glycosyl hydrolase family 28-related protein [Paenibacillus caseinilyticus]
MASQEVVCVKEFGAVEGGKEDCTEAFNKATAAARDRGLKIFVPGGRWRIDGELIGINNVYFEGVSNNKQYNNKFVEELLFDGASTVLVGNGSNYTFGSCNEQDRASFDHICFTGFKALAATTAERGFSPRSYRFRNCSFQGMRVLDAPADLPYAIHNFRFFSCDFTNYGFISLYGRIIDTIAKECTFVGGTPIVLSDARANVFAHSRVEWADSAYAIQLTGCDHQLFTDCFYDRIAGPAFQFREGNKHINIVGGLFNRCGSLLKSDGKPLEGTYNDSHRCFIRVFDNNEDIRFANNTFGVERSSDRGTGLMTPNYVVGLMWPNKGNNPGGLPIKMTWKNNTVHTASIKGWLFSENGSYTGRVEVETDAAFGQLNDQVTSLARHATHPVRVTNWDDVSVSLIPEMLEIDNRANIKIPAGMQHGKVFGGYINGIQRYHRPETLAEHNQLQTAAGGGTFRMVEYVIPTPKPVRGGPVTLSLAYSATAGINGQAIVFDDQTPPNKLADLPDLAPTGDLDARGLYQAVYQVPAGYSQATMRVRFYATRDLPLTAAAQLNAYALSATYGYGAARTIVDRL